MNFYMVNLLLGIGLGQLLKIAADRSLQKYKKEWDREEDSVSGLASMLCMIVLLSLIFLQKGIRTDACLDGMVTFALVVISLVDLKIMMIPPEWNFFLFVCGFLRFVLSMNSLKSAILGFFLVGLPLWLLFLASRGALLGGGDAKLMAVCGFYLGAEAILPAFFLGCILAVLIQSVRIGFFGAGKRFAMAPYLCMGVYIFIIS